MSGPVGAQRWLAKEMLEAARAARRHDDLKDGADRSLHIVGWLMSHLTDAEHAQVEGLVFGVSRSEEESKPVSATSAGAGAAQG